MQDTNENYIQLEKVSKIYGTKEVKIIAVDEISFNISKGEFAVIVGPSGAGKTTVLNILGGMDTATVGKVCRWENIVGIITARRPATEEMILALFSSFITVPNLTALENVELAGQIVRTLWIRKTVLKKWIGRTDLELSQLGCMESSREFP